MNSAAHSTRSALQLTQSEFDLLVIGGGIVGARFAHDAAMRGLRVALFVQNDFASGTSSRSSRRLHGGLRYLAQSHVRFVFPTYRGTPWPKWKPGIGVKLYDWLCGGTNFRRSAAQSQAATIELLPNLLQDADLANRQIADYYRAMNEATPWRRSDNFKQRVEE